MNIIEKSDDYQRAFLSEGTMDVSEILENDYPYILESMAEEGFILKYDTCNLFKEIVFERKVVGFCSYDFSREFITAALNNIYVLPEYRGNGLFLAELKKTMESHNKPSIMEPTRLVVELLLKYGFAAKLTDSLVASSIEFVVPGDHVISNDDYNHDELSTHFYDLDLCASIHVLDLDNAHVAYSAPLNYDIIHYDCLDFRSGADDEYFNGLVEFFAQNEPDIMEVLKGLEGSLPVKTYTLEEVVGPDGEFSVYIESLIDDAHVTRQRAFEIKSQIIEEHEKGMVLDESLMIRMAYLFDENRNPTITSHEEVCRYCGMPVDSHDRFCHFCGINLGYDGSD